MSGSWISAGFREKFYKIRIFWYNWGMKGTIYGIFAVIGLLVCIGIGLFRLGAVRCKLDVVQAQETQIRQKIQTETEISRRVLAIPDDDNLEWLLVSHLRAD